MSEKALANRIKFWADGFEHCPKLTTDEQRQSGKADGFVGGAAFAAKLIVGLDPRRSINISDREVLNGIANLGYKKVHPETLFNLAFADEMLERYQANFRTDSNAFFKLDVVAIIYETCDAVIDDSVSLGNFRTEGLGSFSSLYASVRTIEKFDSTAFRAHISEILEKAMVELEYEANKKRMDAATSFSKALEDEKQNCFSAIAEERDEILNTFKDEAEKQVVNIVEAMRTGLILKDATDLWQAKGTGHKRAFWGASVLFAAMIFIPLFAGWYYRGSIETEIEKLFPVSDSIPFGRLLVITIPLLGYAWLLRLVSRYLNLNLTLRHDADQRCVMAKTFVQLVNQGAANDDQDRALILGALFRPAPGTNTEDDHPPNVIGMIKKEILPDGKS